MIKILPTNLRRPATGRRPRVRTVRPHAGRPAVTPSIETAARTPIHRPGAMPPAGSMPPARPRPASFLSRAVCSSLVALAAMFLPVSEDYAAETGEAPRKKKATATAAASRTSPNPVSFNTENGPPKKKTDAKPSYYQPPLSYSTARDPDPPAYVRNASKSYVEALKRWDWLDLGLDHRLRYEYRDDDIRRPRRGSDEPLLNRTRLYVGIKEELDPLRLAFEVQDARRYHSRYERDIRDVNEFEITRAYLELYLKDAFGYDGLKNPRPLGLRYGIHNFEFLDRRLIANNQFRNTANTFQGFQGYAGQDRNDWSLDVLAVQPRDRLKYDFDRAIDNTWFYAAIGHFRQWSKFITLEPYHLTLRQESVGTAAERIVHNEGLRVHGKIGGTGFDYDAAINLQHGFNGGRDHRAIAGNGEIGYTFNHAWKPRLSFFYGYASGDEDPNDGEDNRFERFYGFGRPFSASDYIVFENISTPKLRLEFTPARKLRIDLGYSAYWLASGTDRLANANNARDVTGKSGSFVGHEYDIRARYALNDLTEFTLGYAHFDCGEFLEKRLNRDNTEFLYFEFVQRFF